MISTLKRIKRRSILIRSTKNYSTTRQSIIGALRRRTHHNSTIYGKHSTTHSPGHKTIITKGNPRIAQVFKGKSFRWNKTIYPAWQDLSMPSLWTIWKITDHSTRMHTYIWWKYKRNSLKFKTDIMSQLFCQGRIERMEKNIPQWCAFQYESTSL